MKLTPVVTCEHGGNMIPPAYNHLFTNASEVLKSHRGWDPGALEIANELSRHLNAPLLKCEATRLLVEPNRSLFSESLFSEYSARLTAAEREEVLKGYYHPHRSSVEKWIEASIGRIVHLSVHSFTPVLNNITRLVDVGLLFDPDRSNEALFCRKYRDALMTLLPEKTISFNAPYKGIDDGFTTHLRTVFDDDKYLGIEIEVNQKYTEPMVNEEIVDALKRALDSTLR
ncbi:MAG: N-formylglutamate amidohydrolase [Chryseolinea sp.]